MSLHDRAVLLDLDGTLTDPFEGITRCIQHALRELGAPCPAALDLAFCIGPPLRRSFASLLGEGREHEVEVAMTLYRARFADVGLFENRLYAGIPDALADLRKQGARLFVATSKPHVYARRIVEHFGLEPFLDAVHGAELDGTRSEKHEVIGWLLREQRVAADRCVMVGDRHHDVLGAATHAIPTVGVLWGYGSIDELRGAGARAICHAPGELPEAVAGAVAGVLRGV